MDITSLTAVELGKKIKAKEISVVEAVKASIAQIEKVEKDVNSFVTLDKEGALKRAEEVQTLIDDGTLTGPLAGVPVAIKDNMCTKGMLTTCSSKILGNFQPMFTAEAVKNLEAAGAVILGKTNMDEFAMGSTTETSYFGPTKNPWNLEHVPGGSSGGSCAAVAAEEAPYALGSDTGGSIRQPSSFCGVVGIKPTYGTVSRYGLIAYGSSLDQIGPVAKDVTDCATILETIASYDPKDSTSIKRESYDFTSALVDDVKGMRIGIPKDYFGDGLDAEVKENILQAVKVLEEKGAVVEEFDLSLVKYAIPAYYVIASAEASSNLARFDGVKYGYRTDVQTGCDVEMKGKLRMPVAERYFCREECEIIRNGKDEKEQAEWFYRFWVLKESFMKATRRGMGLDMRTYEFAWGQDGIPYLKKQPEEYPEKYLCREYELEQGDARVAVITTDNEIEGRLHEVRLA